MWEVFCPRSITLSPILFNSFVCVIGLPLEDINGKGNGNGSRVLFSCGGVFKSQKKKNLNFAIFCKEQKYFIPFKKGLRQVEVSYRVSGIQLCQR